jgi:YD repeat-containing protein
MLVLSASHASAETYTYDATGRLTSVTYDDGSSIVYTYDATGNILAQEVDLTNLDSDEDGLSDALEVTTCTEVEDADTDDDGFLDGDEDINANGEVDAGETDPCESDTDFDGIQDGTELGYTIEDIGPDTDTNLFQPDLDPQTTTDPLNEDTDGDGISDGDEDFNYNGRLDEGESDPNLRDTAAMPWIPILLEE